MRCDDCRSALDAYVDGELMPEEAETIRDHLASCGQCGAEHETLVALSRRLKEGLERRRAPDVLKARIRSALAQPDDVTRSNPPRRLSWAGLIAAGLVVVAVTAGASFAAGRRGAAPPSIAEQVLSSHVRSLMPGHLTDVTSNDLHNVKPWFNGRVDLSPVVPRLDSAGFPLVGGRVDYVGRRPVAAVIYTRRQHVINVFSWPVDDHGSQKATVSTAQGYHLVRWKNGGAEFWAASDLSVPELDQFVALFARSESASAAK